MSDGYFVATHFARAATIPFRKKDLETKRSRGTRETVILPTTTKKRIFHMTKSKSRFARRALSLSLVILTLVALVLSLSACTGGGAKKISPQAKEETDASYVARVISTNENYRIRFAAAYRGYDITAEDFEDSDALLSPSVEFGKKVLEDAFKSAKFDSTSDKETFETYMNDLTEATMKDVIESDSFAKEYNLKHKNGFPTILLVWIGKFLGLLTRIVGNYYVIAIIIFAFIVEVLMLPVSIKQQKNSVGMAKLRPQIAKIEKKYAGRTDQVTQRKKQEEIMELQQKSGYSAFSGCLPLILQLIIVGFILYPIIQNPLRYVLDESTAFSEALMSYATAPKAAGGLGLSISSSGNVMELLAALTESGKISGIADFALIGNGAEILNEFNGLAIPDFTAFGINLGRLPSFTSILILVPILNVLGQWVSMFLTRRWTNTGYNQMGVADGQDKFSLRLMDILPLLMTVFILFKVPAMIGVYWFIRSLFSLAKQFIMKTVYPVPKYTAEELKELEKMEKERQKTQKEALRQQPKYRSLHYIDEDDYDELPELKQDKKTQPKKFSSQDAPEIKD